MHIDFLIADNDYSTAAYFSEQLAKSLEKLGIRTRLFWIGGGNFYKAYYAIRENPPDLTCSFSNITIGEGELLADLWQIPHLNLFLDHAIYYLHHTKSPYSLISCIDKEDLLLLKKMGFEKVFFLPHAVSADLFEEKAHEKKYDLVLIASCIDVEKIEKRWEKTFSKYECQRLYEAAERVLQSKSTSCLEALADMDRLPLMHHELETYVRGRDRIALVSSLSQFNLHIWGNGPWKKYAPSATVHKPLPFPDALEVMKRAKIVLNSLPTLKFGAHERIFHAYATHALPLTSVTNYLEEEFENEKSIAMYRYKEDLHKRVEHYLDDHVRRSIVEAGREITRASHTWDNRAQVIDSYTNSLCLGSGNWDICSLV